MEFRILGPLEVVERGTPVPLGGPQQKAVLCLLLLHANQVVSGDRLVDELWDERPPPTAAKTLRVYLSRLRKLLGDRLPRRTAGYVLRVEEDELDLERFERLRERARELDAAAAADTLRRALRLWRGPPLADFAYEAWAQSEIARLEELRIVCLEERIEADLALGRHAELVGELEALVAGHRLRERLRGQLMLALYRSGRQAEALQAYQAARAVLVDELGIDPSPDLQQLEKAILVQDPALQAPEPRPARLPAPAEQAAAAPAHAARKTVTVVFVDLVDSTALAEALDPEVVRGLIGRYFEAVAQALERHGATLEKFIGDAVMAVFGLPTVHEDDALRAVRAAVEAREALAALNSESGPAISVHIGIESGEVVVGERSDRQALITGEAVNVAARLQHTAGAGEILIGAATYGLVRDAVEAELLPPLEVKGKTGVVTAFRLLGLRSTATPAAARLVSPFVGRERERERLQQAFEQAAADQACHLFTVLGAAGIGKSRLVAEFLAGVRDRATVLRGRCLPYGDGITFWPLLEACRDATGLDSDAPAEDVRARLSSIEPTAAERVAGLLGLAEPAGDATESFWGVRRLFESLAGDRPLVLVFDDVHWAEPTFLDLVDHIAERSRGAPILLVCAARPELLDTRPGWGGGKLNATSVLLEPLSASECERLLQNLLGQAELGRRARTRILDAADGNPLFVEELLAMLIDTGRLRRLNGGWAAAGDLDAASIPPTIQLLLAARLDLLEREERAILEVAAVEGAVFHAGAVAVLAQGQPHESRLESLVRKELVRPAASSFPGEEAFRFRHILIRDAAYRSLTKEARAELHERFARWLEQKVGPGTSEYEEILGHHLAQAHRYHVELGASGDAVTELAVRAGERLASAGRRASQRGDVTGAVSLLTHAAELLPRGDRRRLELAPYLGLALRDMGDLGRAREVLGDAERESAAAGLHGAHAHAIHARLLLELATEPEGIADALQAQARRLIPVFERLGDERGIARAWQLVAISRWISARAAEAEEALAPALEHAQLAADRDLEGRILGWRLTIALYGPTPVPDAIRLCEATLSTSATLGLRAVALTQLALLRGMVGEFAEARGHVAEARALLDELGHTILLAGVGERAGLLELLAADPVAAEAEFRRTYEEYERMGEKTWLSTQAAYLARAAYDQQRFDEAAELTRISEEAAASDDLVSQVVWRSTRAKVAAQRGELAEAERLARDAAELASRSDFLVVRGDALVDLAEVLRVAERPREAARALHEALELYERKGNLVAAAATEALIAAQPEPAR